MKFHGLKRMLAAPLMVLALGAPVAGVAEASVGLDVFAPNNGDLAGVGSRGFLVDLVARYDRSLAATGASLELTGPGAHANTAPLPGSSSAGANADHFPGLVVLLSSSRVGAGAGQNLANLFNIVAVTNQTSSETDIWSTWIIGGPNAFGSVGQLTRTRLFVAVVDGVAPNVVSDLDHNGVFDEKDLALMGLHVISNVRKIDFTINGF